MTSRIVASGYYGFANLGDEAVLAGVQAGLNQAAKQPVALTALTSDVAYTQRLHAIDGVQRTSFRQVADVIRASDLLVSGGGSLFQDVTSLRSLLYYAGICRMARYTRTRYMFYAQGVGPLRRRISRRLFKWVANGAAFITVRDDESARLLHHLGVHAHIEVTADAALSVQPAAPSAAATLLTDHGIDPEEPILGVALRPWRTSRPLVALDRSAQLLQQLHAETGYRILMIPMHTPGDRLYAESVVARAGPESGALVLRNDCDPALALALAGRMKLIVAMRLHALVFAARMRVPSFGLTYDPKIRAFLGGLGADGLMADFHNFEPSSVALQVADALNRSDAIMAEQEQRIARMERRSLRSAERAIECIPSQRVVQRRAADV
ncbi:MAG: polysaccharide pyruvyl transferase CsaB [Armatimonadetes bacterium]|nr:polysaccharide pyruvyl transferase CsaB [Armatimonadota bacterium]MDE2207513.1 polysaccharide pyruvyl transferase CsaB [Armatimonadota bacterium]